ncbi:acetyltransferase [Empedobacter falsenii]
MYLFGANGHGKVVVEIAELLDLTIDGIIDNAPISDELFGYPILSNIPNNCKELFISIGDNATRKNIAIQNLSINFPTLIHPKASISKRAKIAQGTVVMSGVSINSEVKVGKHCIINTNSSLDHECKIGDYVHISPNVALAGNVEVGEGTHIGIGASVIQGIKIGKWCTIGAGAVIIKDIPDGATVVGNPGKIIKIKDINV